MSISRVISLAAVAALGIALVSADAFAARVAARGGAVAVRAGAVGVRGGVYGGGYYRPGVGLAAGAVGGGAVAASAGYGYGGGYGSAYGYDPGYSYAATSGYAGGCSTDGGMIMCNGRCWLNEHAANYAWGECSAIHVKVH